MFRMAAGFVPLTAGDISVSTESGDASIVSWPAERRARTGIAYISQDRRILRGASALNNLRIRLYALPNRYTTDEIFQTVADMGLGRLFDFDPSDMTPERSLWLLLARAVLAKPALLMLDEPFAHLDSAGVKHCIWLRLSSFPRNAADNRARLLVRAFTACACGHRSRLEFQEGDRSAAELRRFAA